MSTINPLARPSTGSLRPQDIPGTGIEEHGEPGLGTLLRHLTDLLDEGSDTDQKNQLRSLRYGAAQIERIFSGSRQTALQDSAAASRKAS
jgi:hypothetical protein